MVQGRQPARTRDTVPRLGCQVGHMCQRVIRALNDGGGLFNWCAIEGGVRSV